MKYICDDCGEIFETEKQIYVSCKKCGSENCTACD